jgi:hypothetical protein
MNVVAVSEMLTSRVLQALGPGLSEAASMLRAASQHYTERDARCETLLESIRELPRDPESTVDSLARAVIDCVFTAGWVHRIPLQREILRAAIYGRAHAPATVDAALIPLCARHLRLLNTLRNATGVRYHYLCARMGLKSCCNCHPCSSFSFEMCILAQIPQWLCEQQSKI